MTLFEIDYSKAQEFAKVTDGTYEVIVDKAVQNASQGGTDFLDIQFKIREDFNQPFKNNRIFHKIWIKKETGKYPVGQVMTAAVLAVQGAFAEHEQKLDELGINHIELRERADLDRDFDALILPGGESTVQGKLLRELGMFDALKDRIQHGLPVLATCAGMILLAESIENDDRQYFATLPVTVGRNGGSSDWTADYHYHRHFLL